MSLTNLTKPRARWATFKLNALGAILRDVYSKLIEGGVSVRDFGATGDGTTDDSEAIQAAITFSKTLYFSEGNYLITKPLTYSTQSKFKGSYSAMAYGKQSTILIKRDSWSGASLFQREDNTTPSQAILFENLSFAGYADIQYNNLSDAEDIGVSAVDVSYIRDGVEFIGCSFKNLGTAVNQISSAGYLGFIVLRDCHFDKCYRAIDARPTTGLFLDGVRIYDCYDWIISNKVFMDNASFNNSSLSSESCGIHADFVTGNGCWFEGGNRWISGDLSTSKELYFKFEQCYLSESYSSQGYSKFAVGVPNDVSHAVIIFEGCKMPINTRLTDFALNNTQLENCKLVIKDCTRVRDLYGADSGKIATYVRNGLEYEGSGNEMGGSYSDVNINSSFTRKGSVSSIEGIGVLGYKVGTGVSLDFQNNLLTGHTPYSTTEVGFAKFTLVGNGDGAGTNSAYYTEFVVAKGYDDTGWALYLNGSDGQSSSKSITASIADISISNESNGGFTLTVTPTHPGNKSHDVLFLTDRSANITRDV